MEERNVFHTAETVELVLGFFGDRGIVDFWIDWRFFTACRSSPCVSFFLGLPRSPVSKEKRKGMFTWFLPVDWIDWIMIGIVATIHTNFHGIQFCRNADRTFQRHDFRVPMEVEVLVEMFQENWFIHERMMSVRIQPMPDGVQEHWKYKEQS